MKVDRASKQGRWRRISVLWFALTPAIVGWWLIRSSTLTPGGAFDFASRFNELARKHQPGGPDAPNRIEEVDRLFLDMDAAMRGACAKQRPDDPVLWPGDHWGALINPRADALDRAVCRTALAELRNTDFFDRLDSLRGAAAWRELPQGSTLDEQGDIVRLSDYRALVRLCRSEMAWAEGAGQYDRIAEAFSRGMIMADLVRQQPTAMSQLTAVGSASTMLEGMRHEMTAGRSMPSALARLRAAIDLIDDSVDERLAMEVYRLHQLQYLRSIHANGGLTGGMLVVSELRGFSYASNDDAWIRRVARHPLGNATAPLFHGLREKNRRMNELVDGMLGRIEDREARRVPSFDPRAFARRRLSWRDAPIQYEYLIIWHIESQLLNEQLERRSLRVLWAIEMYHAMTGVYPEALDALRPSLLGEIPRDPFAPALPLGYLRRDPNEADPRGYLLFSVGADGVDDGGNDDPEWALKAIDPARGAGYDLVVNRLPGR